MKTVLAIAAMAALGIGGGAWMLRTPPLEDRLVEACGETIRDRLKAPSTYTLIEAKHYSCKPAGWERHLAWDYPEVRRIEIERINRIADLRQLHEHSVELHDGDPLAKVWIVYKAQNALGVPLRSTSECRVTVPSCEPDAEWGGIFGPLVDGYDSFDWGLR